MTYTELFTCGLILVQIKTRYISYKFNEAQYNHHDKVMVKEFRWISKQDQDKQLIKGWFCFLFINDRKANKAKNTSDTVKDVQRKLHQKLQKECKGKVRKFKST